MSYQTIEIQVGNIKEGEEFHWAKAPAYVKHNDVPTVVYITLNPVQYGVQRLQPLI